jgi:glucokinase
VVPGGRACGCGAHGCLEAYASGTALARSARAAAMADPIGARRLLDRAGGDAERIDGLAVTSLALDGDPMARRLMAELGGWLGAGLAQVTTVLDPRVIVVGGGIVDAAGELIVAPARRAYAAALSMRRVREGAPLRPAGLGNAAGLVGAGARAAMAAAGLPTLSTID